MRDGEWLDDEVRRFVRATFFFFPGNCATGRHLIPHILQIISFYMGLLLQRQRQMEGLNDDAKAPRVHFLNSYFYAKLYSDTQEYDFKPVRRWTTEKKLGYSLLDCERVVIPLHKGNHWVLGVVDLREKRVSYYDSLKGVDRTCMRNLITWIVDEAKEKRQLQWDASEWSTDAPQDIPPQLNGCDCGVFTLKYADFLARNAPLDFSQHDSAFRAASMNLAKELCKPAHSC